MSFGSESQGASTNARTPPVVTALDQKQHFQTGYRQVFQLLQQDKEKPTLRNDQSGHFETSQKSILQQDSQTYDTAWAVLQYHEKWRDASFPSSTKKSAPSTTPAPSSEAHTNTQTAASDNAEDPPLSLNEMAPQPVGIKQAKQKAADDRLSKKKLKIMEKNAAEGAKQSAQFKKANKLQEKTNKISKLEAELKLEQMNMSIMDKDLSTLMDPYAKEYFMTKKKAIMDEMQEKERKKQQQSEAALNVITSSNDQSDSQSASQSKGEDSKLESKDHNSANDEDTLPLDPLLGELA
ncbi:hypothetical protein PtA15_11A349 [Puccinia triticina]|uniref:No apical meristem-associated C-terminal domain-containing protein n=1 Tax=Puccinia triticina TaxID=208348 RepID=A0ABY7CWJ4_9BASI|nr:uncharacterized protein PtA15_11A349 [Puccinia triticina]WAQ89659.1 hypothetical protein PtA15_11A349 [Puccinia triticina]